MTDKNVSVLTSGSYTGSQTVREFEVTDLKVEDGKLNGTAVGSVEKEGTGVVDKVRLSFTDVPFEGVGGGSGSGVEFMNIVTDYSETDSMYVYSVDKTYEELCEAAASGKLIVCNMTKGTGDYAYRTTTRHVVSVMVSPGPTPQYGFTFVTYFVKTTIIPGNKDKLIGISETVFNWYPDMETPQVDTVYYYVAQYDDGGK